jgi:U3 small nucleolar RNA-associated protein 4
VQLPAGREDEFAVVKVFGQHGERESGRELRGKLAVKSVNGDVTMNGVNGNGGAHHGSGSDSDSDSDGESEEEQPEIISTASKPALVTTMAVSGDGQWLASADLERKICIFDLDALKVSASSVLMRSVQGHGSRCHCLLSFSQHHTTLPTSSEVPVAMAFLPGVDSETSLMLAMPSNALLCFGLDTLRFQPWARPLSSLASNTLMDIREPILGITLEPMKDDTKRRTSEQVMIVWGANWIAKIDLEKVQQLEFAPTSGSKKSTKPPLRREADRKRARDEADQDSDIAAVDLDIKVTRKYQPLVLFDFIGQGELVAVERTWLDVSKGMVDAFVKSGEFAT